MSQAEGTPEVCVECNNPNQSSADAKADSGNVDAATFIPPIPHPDPSIIIEFCDRVSTIGSASDLLDYF